MRTQVLSLLLKEVEQFRPVFIWLVVFTFGITSIFRFLMTNGGGVVSYLTLTSLFASPTLIIIAFLIGQKLIVSEYYNHTQRFVEALPVRRSYVATVKYAVGLIALLVLTTGVWLYSMSLATSHESISTQFAGFMVIRLAIYVFVLWSVVFTFSLLGRMRIPLIVAVAVLISLMDTYTSFELARFGPFALINPDLFSSERIALPVTEIVESLLTGCLVLSMSAVLLGLREGSFTETLAVPMSRGEKTFLLIMVILGPTMFSYFDLEPEESTFEFTDSAVVSGDRIQVAYLDEPYKSDANTLVDFLAEPIRTLNALVPFPGKDFKIRISLTPHLKPMEYRMDFGSYRQGMLVNADFRSDPRWSLDFFGAFIVHQILQVSTNGRVTLEPNHALLDGFSLWWTLHHRPASTPEATVNPFLLQALYANEIQQVTPDRLRQWDVTSESLGDILGMALSYSGWKVLEDLVGSQTLSSFAKQEFGRPVHGDVRDWWSDWRTPLPDRFKLSTGLDWEDFVTTWAARLDELRENPDYAAALDKIPTATTSFTAEVTPEGGRILRYKLTVNKPLPADRECTAFHGQLSAYDQPAGMVPLREVSFTRSDSSSLVIEHVISGQYADGTRIYAAIECELAGFDLPVRLGSARFTIL